MAWLSLQYVLEQPFTAQDSFRLPHLHFASSALCRQPVSETFLLLQLLLHSAQQTTQLHVVLAVS